MKSRFTFNVSSYLFPSISYLCSQHLQALELARSNQDSIKDEIWRELAAAKYARWEAAAAQRAIDRERLKARLTAALAALHQQEAQQAAQPAIQREAGPSHVRAALPAAVCRKFCFQGCLKPLAGRPLYFCINPSIDGLREGSG